MGKRQSIGLIFSYNEYWIGGSYYVLNIIKTLNFLEDSQKPMLYIIVNYISDFKKVEELKYPYVKLLPIKKSLTNTQQFLNKISGRLIKKNIFAIHNDLSLVNIIFPASFHEDFNVIKKKIFWIPDFQEHYLPQFFEKTEIENRKKDQLKIAAKKNVLFSSKNALNDFEKFYPNSKAKKYVFNFTSILPKVNTNIDEIRIKYNLSKSKFLFSPNQFWKHKNQIIILKTLKKIKESGNLNFNVYFSGKEYDYRFPDYFQELNQFVINNNLTENVRFLGFIDREDQICLMDNAQAIIQPSLFEGWSTVIEDAKALNQNIIASNLDVHKEQLEDKAFFFNPLDEDSLIVQINKVMKLEKKLFDFNYKESIKKSAIDFLAIIKDVDDSIE